MAKTMPPAHQGAVDCSTVSPATRNVAEMTASIKGESPRPASILIKRLNTWEGLNTLVIMLDGLDTDCCGDMRVLVQET